MASKLHRNLLRDEDELMDGEGQPVHPMSQSLCVSPMALCINCVFEFEEAITEFSRVTKNMADALLPRNPLFSCIMVVALLLLLFTRKDDRGVLRWQKTTVNVDDHIYIAEFPPAQESYDACVDDYVSKLALKPLDQSRPLWELHLLNYKTSKAGATFVIKVHHSLGDGISFMSTLFSFVRRVDNPDLPLTFPSANRINRSTTISKQSVTTYLFHIVWYFILLVWYTIVDVINSSLRETGWIDDSQLPIRGPPGVEHMPTALSSATFHLEDVKQIKNSVGGTVNDVITGVIFYGMQRYLQIRLSAVEEHSLQAAYEKSSEPPKNFVVKQMKKSRVTALCVLNTRVLGELQSIDEMLKPKTQSPWGNHFGFLHVRVPIMEKMENPLEFVRTAKRMIDRQKMSLGVFINAKILRCLVRLKGPQGGLRAVGCESASHPTARRPPGGKIVAPLDFFQYFCQNNDTISNMIGPIEKIAVEGNVIKSFSFFITGAPLSLYLCVLSYMGTIKIQAAGPKAYMEPNILSKCLVEAFEEIKEASIHSKLRFNVGVINPYLFCVLGFVF